MQFVLTKINYHLFGSFILITYICRMEIELICKCKCEYLTIKFINGAWNTMLEKTFIKHFGCIKLDIISTYNCNACINNWTIENNSYILGQIKTLSIWKR